MDREPDHEHQAKQVASEFRQIGGQDWTARALFGAGVLALVAAVYLFVFDVSRVLVVLSIILGVALAVVGAFTGAHAEAIEEGDRATDGAARSSRRS